MSNSKTTPSKDSPKVNKRVYKHVMPKEDLLASLNDEPTASTFDLPLSEKEDDEQKSKMIKSILSNEKSQTYYWRVVFAYTFRVYKQIKDRENQRMLEDDQPEFSPKKKLRKLSLKNLAEDAEIDYYKFKRLFQGKGHAENVLEYIMFLHRYGISFVSIASQKALILKAYKYYELVMIGIDPEDLSELKF